MSGQLDGPGITLIVFYCIVFIVAMCMSHSWREFLVSLSIMAAVVMLGNLAGSAWIDETKTTGYASGADAASVMGLTPDHSYPFVLGSRVSGSAGTVTATGGLFYASSVTTLQPASSITIGFTARGSSYILEIPASQLTIHQTAGPEQMQLHFQDGVLRGSSWSYKVSDCRYQFHLLAPSCMRHVVSKTLEIGNETRRHGLAPLVQHWLDSATVWLSPKDYSQLVGGPSAGA